jgi:23S rRNA-/tRNA-specific pseudouridylate synthase
MGNIIIVVIRIFICKFGHIWREWVSAVGREQLRKPLNIPAMKEVEILYKSQNFLVINKGHDIVINSDDPTVKVCYLLLEKENCLLFVCSGMFYVFSVDI